MDDKKSTLGLSPAKLASLFEDFDDELVGIVKGVIGGGNVSWDDILDKPEITGSQAETTYPYTIKANLWSDNTYTINLEDTAEDTFITVDMADNPTPEIVREFARATIVKKSVSEDALVLMCLETPTMDLPVEVTFKGAGNIGDDPIVKHTVRFFGPETAGSNNFVLYETHYVEDGGYAYFDGDEQQWNYDFHAFRGWNFGTYNPGNFEDNGIADVKDLNRYPIYKDEDFYAYISGEVGGGDTGY